MNMETEYAHTVLEHMSTAVVLLDGNHHVLELNHAAEMLFRVSARQVRGLRAVEIAPDTDLIGSLVEECDKTGQSYTERERRLPLAGGSVVTVDVTVTPLPAGGVMLEFAAVDRPARISREHHLLSQNRAIQELIRGLAHEVKNPLGGLRGAAQLLRTELDRSELEDYTAVIIREADRLQELVDALLGPTQPARSEPVNLHEVLEHVRALVEAEGEGTPVERDYDPSIPQVRADSNHLVQALLNLVRNARQAAGPEGSVIVRTRSQRQFTIGDRFHRLVARVDVIDDGPGIPPDQQERIFYPMVTTRATGTGLGLPLAQNLVSRHGGLVECASEPGHTVFTVWLPVEAQDA